MQGSCANRPQDPNAEHGLLAFSLGLLKPVEIVGRHLRLPEVWGLSRGGVSCPLLGLLMCSSVLKHRCRGCVCKKKKITSATAESKVAYCVKFISPIIEFSEKQQTNKQYVPPTDLISGLDRRLTSPRRPIVGLSPSKHTEGPTKHRTQQGTANRRLMRPFMLELSKKKSPDGLLAATWHFHWPKLGSLETNSRTPACKLKLWPIFFFFSWHNLLAHCSLFLWGRGRTGEADCSHDFYKMEKKNNHCKVSLSPRPSLCCRNYLARCKSQQRQPLINLEWFEWRQISAGLS